MARKNGRDILANRSRDVIGIKCTIVLEKKKGVHGRKKGGGRGERGGNNENYKEIKEKKSERAGRNTEAWIYGGEKIVKGIINCINNIWN